MSDGSLYETWVINAQHYLQQFITTRKIKTLYSKYTSRNKFRLKTKICTNASTWFGIWIAYDLLIVYIKILCMYIMLSLVFNIHTFYICFENCSWFMPFF